MDPEKKLVQQRRRVFAPERNQAITDEVSKLLATNFIREVYYPDWLANVVLLESKWKIEDVCRLHRLKQDLPEEQFFSAKDRSTSGFHSRT